MRIVHLAGFAILSLLLSACSVKKIPGTDIDDTGDTRVILDVLTKYRAAVENRDSAEFAKLADETFRDDGGSSVRADDLDRAALSSKLPDILKHFEDVKLDITVRKVEFDEDQANAKVTYTYSLSFRVPQYSSKTFTETDIKQMSFHKNGDRDWKIAGGT